MDKTVNIPSKTSKYFIFYDEVLDGFVKIFHLTLHNSLCFISEVLDGIGIKYSIQNFIIFYFDSSGAAGGGSIASVLVVSLRLMFSHSAFLLFSLSFIIAAILPK
jgi:hypothetical protein